MSPEEAKDTEGVPAPDPGGPTRKPPAEAIAEAHVRAPTRGNRRLESFIDTVNADDQVRGWWYMAQVNAERLGMSDHSWVHMQIVLNISLRLFRLLSKAGVEPAMVADHGMRDRDAEVVVAGGALLHDVGMSIHRTDHEEYSLFLAQSALDRLLAGAYKQPERTVVEAEILHAIIGPTRARGAWSGSPTHSTWPRAAPGSRSSPATKGSTRSPPRRSTRCGSAPARTTRCGSRSS